MRLGVRWADTIFASNGTPSASRVSAACFMVAQSDWLPMIRPTTAFLGGRVTFALAIRLSGDDVGDELAFQLCNLVLEPKLALFQALELQLVERGTLDQPVDHLVEIAVLRLQGFKLCLGRLDVQRVGVVAHRLCAVYPFGSPKPRCRISCPTRSGTSRSSFMPAKGWPRPASTCRNAAAATSTFYCSAAGSPPR